MKLHLQKKLAARVMGVGLAKVKLDPAAKDEIKEAITKADVLGLIKKGVIKVGQAKGVSRHRALARHKQRLKGRQRGHGGRKGRQSARNPTKRAWINRVRLQRKIIKELRNSKNLERKDYRMLYKKIKGGVFRSQKHLLQVVGEINKEAPKIKEKKEVKK